MEMNRRAILIGMGAAAGAPVIASCSRSDTAAPDSATQGAIQPLPLSDPRVEEFLAYRVQTRVDPAPAITEYTAPGFTYTSSAGEKFDAAGLANRINDWRQGFTLVEGTPLWAASLPDGQLMLATRDTVKHQGQFRGQQPTDKTFDTESLFTINYNSDGKITGYTRYTDYGAIADGIGTDDVGALLGLSS